ncbi:hypothetical protein [Indiicoccus explosivorum]|uniref:hypothetical protein n=1 Tax=Indiicoccus explosivorum TaxID=1917864 RepID=UPI000B43ADB1|nr:hypothetical protein [Indiicoccus explosivorum]
MSKKKVRSGEPENDRNRKENAAEANRELNEDFYGEEENSPPPLYINNNTPAIDVDGNKKRDE